MTALRETLDKSIPLGQKTSYPKEYDQGLLHPVKRSLQRDAMEIDRNLVFFGHDIWNAYELSWLNDKGKPVRALGTFIVGANSPNLAESKSVKLYLNSLNQRRFANSAEVNALLERDLSEVCQAPVMVSLSPESLGAISHSELSGYKCIDEVDIKIDTYQKDENLIKVNRHQFGSEKLVSHLFKSHCLCTGQPDWGSIFIEYSGPKIDHEGLLAYLVSYHDHVGFSENCIEQIYVDILKKASCERLLVFGRFTRRGGIDINPYRANFDLDIENTRLVFQ